MPPRNCKAISGTKSSEFFEFQRGNNVQMTKTSITKTKKFETLGIWNFEFVSSFDIRISDL